MEISDKKKKWIGACVFIIVGVISLFIGLSYFKKGVESLKWKNVEGNIVSSQIEKTVTHHGGNTTTSYSLKIKYEYTVAGNKYTGGKIRTVDFGTGFRVYLLNMQSKYCDGQDVKVFYNPQKFEDSVLEPGIHIEDTFFFIFGLLFILGSSPFIMANLRTSKIKIIIKYLLFTLLFIFLTLLIILIADLFYNSFFIKVKSCPAGKTSIETRYDECKTLVGKEKDSCYFGVAGTSLWNDASVCENISDNSQFKAACYSIMAGRKKDSLLCGKIANEVIMDGVIYSNIEIKEQCYNELKK